jgi:hypothetical protein
MSFSEIKETTQNIQQLEKTSYAASKTKIPGEAGSSENTGTIMQKVELEDTRAGKATEADAEVREDECEGEKEWVIQVNK